MTARLERWARETQRLFAGIQMGRQHGFDQLCWRLHQVAYHRRACDCSDCKLVRALVGGMTHQTDEAREIPQALYERIGPPSWELPEEFADIEPPEVEPEVEPDFPEDLDDDEGEEEEEPEDATPGCDHDVDEAHWEPSGVFPAYIPEGCFELNFPRN